MPTIAVYDWSVVTHNGALTPDQLRTDDHANDPAAANYDPGRSSWVGITYTYTGAPATPVKLSDDDPSFQEDVTETGAPQVLLEDVTLNGVTYAAGSVVENEFSLLQDGWIEVFVLRIDGDNVGFVPAAGLPEPFAGAQFSPQSSRDGDPDNSAGGQVNEPTYDDVTCFGAGARIATPDGPRPAGTLAPGALVWTLDHGPQPVLWVGRQTVGFAGPEDGRRPVRIRAGAFGPGRPGRDLLVSPQHRLLLGGAGIEARAEGAGPEVGPDGGLDGRRVGGPVGGPEALGPARGFLGLRGVARARGRGGVTYISLLLQRHEVLSADGLLCESFFPGPMAMRMLPPADRAALRACRPDVPETGLGRDHAARPLLSRRQTAARLATAARITESRAAEARATVKNAAVAQAADSRRPDRAAPALPAPAFA